MPLDVDIVREHVHWTAAAAAALRHGIQAIEDHLARCAADDAELLVEVRGDHDGADIQARLLVGGRVLVRNVQDTDLAWALTRLTQQILEEAEHTLERATTPPPDEPWHQIAVRVSALAHHEVSRAVDLGDVPAGAIDPQDLADDVLAGRVHESTNGHSHPSPSWESLRRGLRMALEGRLAWLAERAEDELSLEAPVDRGTAEGAPIEEDPYAFSQPDETRFTNEDLIAGDEPLVNGARRGP